MAKQKLYCLIIVNMLEEGGNIQVCSFEVKGEKVRPQDWCLDIDIGPAMANWQSHMKYHERQYGFAYCSNGNLKTCSYIDRYMPTISVVSNIYKEKESENL